MLFWALIEGDEYMKDKVFLGGTCNESTWRKTLVTMLRVDYFDPVVDDWTEESIKIEDMQKQVCKYHLYVITKEITGFYSIAEAVYDACIIPKRTLFCVLYNGMNEGQRRSLQAVETLITKCGANIFHNLSDIAGFLNSRK
ncbi:hypothetical protein SDC9_164704 [bioreactor metagenome]|uniref:Uncharacterized protein n=1 Tax=bioreactor metagenome TaxID=1076179 RepID=A0A645FSD1_9ZZZZ